MEFEEHSLTNNPCSLKKASACSVLLTIFCFIVFLGISVQSQEVKGYIYLNEDERIFLNHIYVTNLNTEKTILSKINGAFSIPAKEGDIIRFTSFLTQRKDIKITNDILQKTENFIELKQEYNNIEEVVIKFRPTGNLRTDVERLGYKKRPVHIDKIIGLAKKSKNTTDDDAPMGFKNGGFVLDVNYIYDVISGDAKKKQRLYEYEKAQKSVKNIENYFGKAYFINMKIPENLILDFLLFVYHSDDIYRYTSIENYEAVRPYIDKYLPIYISRLNNNIKMIPK